MINAIYTGLTYGIIAGFGTAAFALTLVALWALIEFVSYILGIYDKIFDTGDSYDGSKRGPGT